MPRSSAPCPMCPKTVAVKFSTERLIVHDTPEGDECGGSELRVPEQKPASGDWKPTPRRKGQAQRPPAEPQALFVASPDASRRKPASEGGSVWAVSGGLPGLGKRR